MTVNDRASTGHLALPDMHLPGGCATGFCLERNASMLSRQQELGKLRAHEMLTASAWASSRCTTAACSSRNLSGLPRAATADRPPAYPVVALTSAGHSE